MTKKELVEYALGRLTSKGAEKAVCSLNDSEKKELNVESDAMSLFRTTFNADLRLTAFVENKKGTTSLNKLNTEAIDSAVDLALELARSAEPDQAHEIAEKHPPEIFTTGLETPDLDLMYDRLGDFVRYSKQTYPDTILENAIIDYTQSKSYFMNSNGLDFLTHAGHYGIIVMFTTKRGQKMSSSNYTMFSTDELDKPIQDYASVDMLLSQSAEQIDTKPVPEKFIGDIVVTPDCMESFLYFITGCIGDYALITGTSIFKEKLNLKIASEAFTLRSCPVSDEIVNNYFITGDGYPAEDTTIIDRGVLRTFLLSLYGSRKAQEQRAPTSGGCYIVEAGNTPYAEMVKGIERGVLVCRFSGGNPSNNGDFSGVAKNSYYIENGEIAYPLSETMISGNLAEILMDIKGISKECIHFGRSVLPWIQFGSTTVSGK